MAKQGVKKKAVTKQAATPLFSRIAQRLSRGAVLRFLLVLVASFVLLESFLLKHLLNSNNYLETYPYQLIFPTLMHLFTALIITAAVYAVKRPTGLGAKLLAVVLLSLFMTDYQARLLSITDLARSLLPILPAPDNDIPVISVLFFVLIFLVVRWISIVFERVQLKYTPLQGTNFIGGLLILLAVLFIGQALPVMKILPAMISQSSISTKPLPKPANAATDPSKPDIFYIVLDRYTSNDVLRNQLGYNNSLFTNYLTGSGFTVRDNAYSNYPYTALSVSSTINAQYTNEFVAPFKDKTVQSRALFHQLAKDATVIKALKDAGYQYHSIGSSYSQTNDAPLADKEYIAEYTLTMPGRTKQLRDFEAIEFQRSPFYSLSKFNLPGWPFKLRQLNQIEIVQQQLQALQEVSTAEKAGGRFVFAHILIPHESYFFNADGSIAANPEPNNVGALNSQKYLGQVSFINQQMMSVIDNIKKQSGGNAVILLNPDEGAYPGILKTTGVNPNPVVADGETGAFGENMAEWPISWLQMKFGIMQAAHIPKATPEDLNNLSSVNLFRIVLNRYLGYELPYLPDCHYALHRGSLYEFNYMDISQKLTGTAKPECKQFESLLSR